MEDHYIAEDEIEYHPNDSSYINFALHDGAVEIAASTEHGDSWTTVVIPAEQAGEFLVTLQAWIEQLKCQH